MKSDIHPEVHAKAKTTCTTCGATFDIPATVEELKVESCCKCHPIYTGKRQIEQKGGRVERFRKRAAAAKKGEK